MNDLFGKFYEYWSRCLYFERILIVSASNIIDMIDGGLVTRFGLCCAHVVPGDNDFPLVLNPVVLWLQCTRRGFERVVSDHSRVHIFGVQSLKPTFEPSVNLVSSLN
jgi:hypothetical protein